MVSEKNAKKNFRKIVLPAKPDYPVNRGISKTKK